MTTATRPRRPVRLDFLAHLAVDCPVCGAPAAHSWRGIRDPATRCLGGKTHPERDVLGRAALAEARERRREATT